MGLGGHDMAIQNRVITTSSALIKCWNFVDGPGVGLRDRDLCHVRLYPFWFEPIAGYRSWTVASNVHSGHLAVGLCNDQGSLLLAGPLFHHPPSIPQWLGTQQKRTRVPLSLNIHRVGGGGGGWGWGWGGGVGVGVGGGGGGGGVVVGGGVGGWGVGGGHDMANEEDPSVFTLNRLQAWYWLRVDLPGLDKMMLDHETASEGPVIVFYILLMGFYWNWPKFPQIMRQTDRTGRVIPLNWRAGYKYFSLVYHI